MKINIYGSTGEIGSKSLYLIKKYFSNIKINLLVANKNYKKLIQQSKIFNPKYIIINDKTKIKLIKDELTNTNVKIIDPDDINEFILKTKSDLSILATSGYDSLHYLNSIFQNTKLLGLVNKECVVCAGHLFKQLLKKNKTYIYPLDSEHFSLNMNSDFNLQKNSQYKNINKIYLTASGGPFLKTSLKKLSQVGFIDAINHPKWKMGYKNSIDSATLANKCLEIIEAHYLFDIPYDLIDVTIHPEAYIHSIIELKNYTSILNYFYPDMAVPLYNFFKFSSKQNIDLDGKTNFNFKVNNALNFYDVDISKYPIFGLFNKLNKEIPSEIIKFNISNEVAVNNFKIGKIKFNEIHEFIDFSLSLDFTHKLNSIIDIVNFQNSFKKLIQNANK